MSSMNVNTLVDLSLNSIAANVAVHGKIFSESHPDSRVYEDYKVLQMLFSQSIVKRIIHIYYDRQETQCPDHFIQFTQFLLQGRLDGNSCLHRSCLNLLFNEYTSHAKLEFQEVCNIPEMFFSVLSSCKNLKRVTLHCCGFSEEWLLNSLSWDSLIVLDLLFSPCSDSLIIHVFDNCPNLEVLKASGISITDQCLYSLCKARNEYDLIPFCCLHGKCCTLGKKLKKITLYDTQITKMGIACALQHLTVLKKFLEGHLKGDNVDLSPLLPLGIRILQLAYLLHDLPLPVLKLSILTYSQHSLTTVRVISLSCPFVNTLMQSQLINTLGIAMLMANENNEVTFGFHSRIEEKITLRFLTSCFEKFQIDHFFTEGPSHLTFDGESLDDNIEPPVSVKSLKKIHLRHISCSGEIGLHFFTRLLSQAVKVQSLTLPGEIAEKSFVNAMETNNFNQLEEVSIHHADLKCISLKHLMQRNKSTLKKIAFLNCRNTTTFVAKHKDIAHKNDVLLVHDNETRKLHNLIKFNLV